MKLFAQNKIRAYGIRCKGNKMKCVYTAIDESKKISKEEIETFKELKIFCVMRI